jgi:hypothetical protein
MVVDRHQRQEAQALPLALGRQYGFPHYPIVAAAPAAEQARSLRRDHFIFEQRAYDNG